MATNSDLATKPPEEEPWWTQVAATTDGEQRDAVTRAPSTFSLAGAADPTGGQTGMPTEFGRYRVRKQLGGGGMGAVYLVENTELKRDEALKVPHFGISDDPDVRERFFREARAAAQLDHPNLCPVYDVGTINGVCFLTMRYLKGKLLSDFTGKPQPVRKAVEIAAKLAHALETAHAKGVIHRDLKPNNVMMCAGVGPVVMDFGLAKQTKGEDHKLTQSGTTMGTPSYMPPEQIKGELDRMGPASDVYSLGVILFEMLTGRLPFKAATVAEIYGLVLHTEVPSPSSLRSGLNPALDAICAKALAKAPEGRYPSMKAFAAALIDFLKSAPAAEGAGNLTPVNATAADIFQAATVAPRQAHAPTAAPGAAHEPTQQGNRTPSWIHEPASTQLAGPQVTVGGTEEKKNRSKAGRLGLLALVLTLLLLGVLGGVGCLVYVLNQKKAEAVAVVTPASLPALSGSPEASESEPPSSALAQEDNTATESQDEPADFKQAPGNPRRSGPPPQRGVVHYKPRPAVVHHNTEPQPVVVHPNNEPQPDPPMEPLIKIDPTIIVTSKPAASTAPASRPGEHTLLNEDFTGLDVGGRPKGWSAPDFGVQTEDNRSCLEVTKASAGMFYATLPKTTIKGDFDMDFELRLGGANARGGFMFAPPPSVGHEFRLDLLTGQGGVSVKVVMDSLGNVSIDGGRAKSAGAFFKSYSANTLHLARKGNVFTVGVNGQETVGRTIAGAGTIQAVKIGLTGGKPAYGTLLACLYSVKITSVDSPDAKPDAAVATSPPALIYEDFNKAEAGRLPAGWTFGSKPNFAVRKNFELTSLQLADTGLGTDQVTLPKVELTGGFNVALAVVMLHPDTAVKIIFEGTKTPMLEVQLENGGTITAGRQPEMDGHRSWRALKTNMLRIERSGKDKDYIIKLNDSEVGSVPVSAAPGPFMKVKLALIVKKELKPLSPQITSVEIVSLGEAP